jgi:acyl-CoA dehydrogenase family member 9
MQEYPYERMLRDSRINMIYEGTNEVLRAYLGFTGLQTPGAGAPCRVTKAHPVLGREAAVLETFTTDLRARIDEAVRRHGREIGEKQHVQRRVADMAIDLFAIAACLSRTTLAIRERGDGGAARDIDLCRAAVAGAERRLAITARSFDDNDDDAKDGVAARAYADGGYALDVLAL